MLMEFLLWSLFQKINYKREQKKTKKKNKKPVNLKLEENNE